MSRKKWTALDKALSPPILDVIRDFKFDLMTPVQVSALIIYSKRTAFDKFP